MKDNRCVFCGRDDPKLMKSCFSDPECPLLIQRELIQRLTLERPNDPPPKERKARRS
jgi:hypothetical protein